MIAIVGVKSIWGFFNWDRGEPIDGLFWFYDLMFI